MSVLKKVEEMVLMLEKQAAVLLDRLMVDLWVVLTVDKKANRVADS